MIAALVARLVVGVLAVAGIVLGAQDPPTHDASEAAQSSAVGSEVPAPTIERDSHLVTLRPGDTVTVAEAGGPPPERARKVPLRVQEKRNAGQPRLVVKRLGVSVPMTRSAQSGNAMVVPDSLREVGWLSSTSNLGARHGSTVLAGHKDNRRARGPLYDLGRSKAGDRLRTVDFWGNIATWRVVSKRSYKRADLPGRLFASYGKRRLVVVTCGGPYALGADGRLHWQRNVAVVAVPVRSAPGV